MAARNREFLNSFVNGTGDQAELLNADGSHNAKALVPRVKNAVMGALIGAENRSLMNDLIDRPQELGIAKAVDGVMRAAPRLMKHNGGPFDLGTALHQALLDLVRIRGEGTKVDDFLAQSTLFADPHRTAESDFLLRQLATGKSANQIAEGLTKYAEMADHIDVTTGDIFGEPLTPRPELLERSYAKPNEEQQQENLAFGKSQSAAGGPEKETLAAQKSIPSVGEDENPHLQEEPPETTVPRGSIPDLRGTEGTGDQGAAVATKARSVSDLRQQFAQQVDQAVVARRSLGTYLRGEAVRLRSAEDLGPRASKFASELLDNFAEDIEQSGHLPLTLQRPIYRADYNAHAADYDRAATAANKALSDGLTALNLTQEELQGPNAPSREVRGIPGIPSIESGDAPPTAPAPKVAEPSPPPKEKVATKKKKRRSFTIRKTRTDEEAA